MTWFTATSVAVNNGQTVVSVNAGDDIQLAQESGGLIIGNNPPVEIKRSYLDGSNNKKIELRSAWPYANQAAQPAVAFPTDGDLAEATAVLKQLIDGFALATQAQAEQGTNNTAAMTALRVKQAIDFFRPLTTSATDTTAGRVWRTNDLVKTTSATDTTSGRLLQVGAGGVQLGADVYRRANILGTVSQSAGVPTGAIIQRGSNANGEFVLFADGTVIATTLARTATTSISESGLFTSGLLGPFPQPFIGIDSHNTFVSGSQENTWFGVLSHPGESLYVKIFALTSGLTSTYRITTIGRWY